MNWPVWLANLVLILHVTWVAAVVLGFLAILYGLVRLRAWAVNPWLRAIHLGMIAYVVLESWLGVPCPLTVWERDLRLLGGQSVVAGSDFIGFWLRRVLFVRLEPALLHSLYAAFGLAVFVTFVLAPPRFHRPVIPSRTPETDRAAA
jgi:hypothetical protein